nr:MAG TPA: hypothetical protein [Caudoviricetes sp.]
MYSVAVYEYDNACKTVYTYDKYEAVDIFRKSVGTSRVVIMYHGCHIVGRWEDSE